MQRVTGKKYNRKKFSSSLVWMTAAFLAVLVAVSVSLVGSSLYRYVHQSDCQISLYDGLIKKRAGHFTNAASLANRVSDPVTRNLTVQYSNQETGEESRQNAFEADDTGQVWKTETPIELFKAEYQNADGIVTVKSADGSKIIAPGTEGSYTFSLKNTSDDSSNYKIWVESNLNSKLTGVPIEMRMSDSHEWLLGGKNSWEQAEDLDGVATTDKIAAGKSEEYTIYWQWPFEQNINMADTSFIGASVNQELSYTVTIHTLATAAVDDEAADSKDQTLESVGKQIRETVKTGDHTQILLWTVLLIVSAGFLYYLFAAKRKNEKNE